MKKILSVIMTAAMLLTLCSALVVPASAIDGAWIVYSKADRYLPDYEGDIMSIPGYEYTEDGLRVIPADWRDFKPGAAVQTKDKVDIKDGVYMEVRIDEFSYEADHWFNFNIWSQPMIKPGSTDEAKWGFGFQELIRTNADRSSWRCEWKTGGKFENKGSTAMGSPINEDGDVILTFKVTWNGSSYALWINEVAAPAAVVEYLNATFSKDSEAYIGFNFQNSTKGGKCAATVLKFGTSEETATTPMGDDYRDPQNFYLTIADIADPSTVEAGKPAIYMNGSRMESDSKIIPKGGQALINVNEDYTVHVLSTATNPYVEFTVKNEVSYDVDDFPIVLMLTKDLCTCGEDSCYALESVDMYIMTGETIGADASCKINELDMSYDAMVFGETSYLYFYYDLSDELAPFDTTGRVNGVRFDFKGVDTQTAGKNAFDICFAAFFRNIKEAEAYVNEYFADLGYTEETETIVTEAPTEPETVPASESETDVTTEVKPEDDTKVETDAETNAETNVDTNVDTKVETEAETSVETEKQTEGKDTEKQTSKQDDDKKEEKTDAPAAEEGGCGSSVGFGAIAVVALSAVLGFVGFKKKD